MAMRRSSPAALAHRPPQPVIWPQTTRRRLCRTPHGGIPPSALLRPAGASRGTRSCERYACAASDCGPFQTSHARCGRIAPSRRIRASALLQSGRLVWDPRFGRWQLTPSESACPGVCAGGGVFGFPRSFGDIDCNLYVGRPYLCGRGGTESTACTGDIHCKSSFRTGWPVESPSASSRSADRRKNASVQNLPELYGCKPFMHVLPRQFIPQVKERNRRNDPFEVIESNKPIPVAGAER